MIHDKTLLFSADSNVKTATLSEPLTAFERFAIVTQPNTYRESTVSANCNRRIDTIGSYTTDGYMIWPTNVVVGGDTKTLDVNHFQLLMQQATTTSTRTFGFNNTAGNCNRILEVYGINRKDGTTAAGEGSPGEGYTAYNETLLASGLSPNMTGDIQLSDRANTYHRLKVGVGAYGENVNIYDVDAPVNWTGWLPLYSYWGTNTGSYYFSEHRYKFSNSATVLTPISGKTHQLGTAAANPYSTTGNYTATDTYIRHPLFAVWGINKKSLRSLTLIPPTAGGTQSASETSGYEYDQITMSNTPDEGWYFSGYNVTGATVNGNIITLQDQDASAQAGFTDAGFPITYQNDGHGTLTGDTNIGIPGQPINLTANYNTYYRLSGYAVTGGYVQDGKLYATAACTAKAVYKVNAFTARGNFNLYGAGQYILNAGASNTAISYAHYTGGVNVPTSYYNVSLTSTDRGNNSVKANGWNPASNISGYRFSGQTIASTYVERVNTRVQCSLQVGSTNFGNKYDVTFRNATNAINNTGTTTTIGKVRRYLTVADAGNSRHYMNDLTNASTNTWTATGIAP